jgi:carboxymethylenebutenolidase
MFGLSWTQRELTRYYARQGFVALSPNYIAEGIPGDRTNALRTKNSLDIEVTVARLIGGAAFLRSLPWVGADRKVGIMGFCLGGGLALLALARSSAFQAGIVYHQSLFPDERELRNIQCKMQCHYGTEDSSTPQSEVDAFTAALDRFGKSYDLYIYKGMGHSFAQFAPDAELPVPQRAAADLSYARSFEFFHKELEGLAEQYAGQSKT